MTARDRLALALDSPDLASAAPLLDELAPEVGVVKIGLELFVREGPRAVDAARRAGAGQVFLDLKLHDIPHTVERAAHGAASLGVDLLTVHAAGGTAMLKAACAGAGGRCRVVAVTALTSLDANALGAIGVPGAPEAWVRRLADLAMASGCAGLVCSPLEARALRAAHPASYLVTPGIRFADHAAGDQARVASPEDAVRAGADLLVVGRPILAAADPREAARSIVRRIASALGE